jgi:hypothetical protein
MTDTGEQESGPLDKLWDAFRTCRDSASSLVAVTLFALGALLFARGLERWRVVAFVKDNGASRSPAPYLASIDAWRGPLAQAGLGSFWFIVTSRVKDIPAACAAAVAVGGALPNGQKLAVLSSDGAAMPAREVCPGAATLASIPVLIIPNSSLALGTDSVFRGGVGVLDEHLVVYYGSRDPRALRDLPGILDLFSGRESLAP